MELSISLSIGAVRNQGGGAPAFSPSDLFSSGEEGVWFDFSDLSTLWQDISATTAVTADGDPIARVDDKSGNGYNATQATGTAQPLYKTSGGIHWSQADGTDDVLRGTWTNAIAQPICIVIGVRYPSSVSGNIITLAQDNVRVLAPNDTAYRINAGANLDHSVSIDANFHVITATFNSTSSSIAQDQSASTGDAGTQSISALNGFGVHGRGNTNFQFSQTDVTQVVVIDRILTAQELSDLEEYIADKSGVTL